jgi:succinate dehydrogenase / fumarate reductase membrane anchor subunit
METPLGQVRGLGSAKQGGHHWWMERLFSIATLVLFIWLAVSLWRLPDLHYGTVTEWLRGTLGAVPMLLLIAATFWHLKMGLQVVVEDYVHEEGDRFFWILLINFAAITAATLAAFAVLKIAFAGSAA